MKRTIAIILVSLLSSYAFSHNEYFIAINSILTATTYPGGTSDRSLLLKWGSQLSAIPVNIKLDAGHFLPGSLSQSQTNTDFNNACNTWHTFSSNVGFTASTDLQSVSIQFTTNATIFGVDANTAGGITGISSTTNNIVPFGGSQTEFGATQIFFNNSTDFTGGFSGARWSNNIVFPNDGVNYFQFESAALHEIGHMLGLGHCSLGINDHSIVMYKGQEFRQVRVVLNQADKTGLTTLYNLTVGVNDYITISGGPSIITQNSNQDYWANFVEVDPPPTNYIVGNYSWSFLVQHGEGQYVAASGTTTPYVNPWHLVLGTLPYGYYWLRDGSGNVKGTVNVTGTDDEGYTHTASFGVGISGVPYNTTSGTLAHNETWGGENNITGNVTVPQGMSLKILPGTILRFNSNTSLIVNGLLNAGASPLSAITFTSQSGTSPGSWGSIQLSGAGASGSSLNGVTMQYGYEIDALSTSNITIQNSNIENTINGIYGYYCSSGSFVNNTITNPRDHGINLIVSPVTCNQNTITKTQYINGQYNYNYQSGGAIICQSGSYGDIWKNTISGFNWGVGAIWGSSPQFMNTSNNWKNNRIMNCLYGVMVYQQSYPTICPSPPGPPL